jgi:hypothetical protein
MRTFELTTRLNPVQRSQGDSATARAAYRACCIIECEREGKTHDYSRKQGRDAGGITLPEGSPAPAWATDRGKLWNAIEQREKNGKRGKNAGAFKAGAQTARDYMFSYPAELSAAGRLNTARIIARHLANTSTIVVDYNIHQPGKDGDERNYHCHMLMSTRRVTATGFGEKAREWDDLKTGPKLTRALRQFVADTLNAELKAEGQSVQVHVEHRSFKDRGSSQKPQQHQGPGGTHALRKKQGQARQAWQARERKAQTERHGKELAGLKVRQDFALAAKLGDLAERERRGTAAIRNELAKAQAADTGPKGASRAFQIATGQAMRGDFTRQTRDAQRLEQAEQKITDLKTGIQAERGAFVTAQTKDRQALTERHKGEDQQFRQAVTARQAFDRAAEVEGRKEQVQGVTREQDHQRDRGPGLAPS